MSYFHEQERNSLEIEHNFNSLFLYFKLLALIGQFFKSCIVMIFEATISTLSPIFSNNSYFAAFPFGLSTSPSHFSFPLL